MTIRLRRDEARQINLNHRPSSSVARELISKLSAEISRSKPRQKLVDACGAVVAALLRTEAGHPGRFSYRPMSRSSFTGQPIGYRSMKAVIDGLSRMGFAEVIVGTGGGPVVHTATRFRATDKLLSFASSHGVQASEWRSHFRALPRPKIIPDPLVLKTSSTTAKGFKRPGESVSIDLTKPEAASLAKQVDEINSFFAGVSIEPPDVHFAFRRVFNQGDARDFNWNKGGRLISVGDSYQQMNAAERGKITINGEPVVEIDIRASHLTVLHAKLNEPFDPHSSDPYAVPRLPREVVKAWVTMTLGYDKFQTRWSAENKRKHKEACGGELQKDYPIAEVRSQVLSALSVLKDWPTCPIRWGDLQYEESCVIVNAVHTLATRHETPALPVHDSIIVPRSKEELATKVLSDLFEQQIGVKPALSTK